jgi:O-antigen ligase/polysaccharide polymerase Wzy-like membrane protein
LHKELAPVTPLGQSGQATLRNDIAENAPAPPLVQWAIIALLVWLPLQTPLAIALFQYAHLSVDAARAVLLVKDLIAALLIATLALLYLKRVHMHWFDWMAVGYLVVLVAYAVIPLALGTKLAPIAIVASAREFLVPVELYGLGRLACAAGVNVGTIVRAFLIVAGVAAAATLILHVFIPSTFWSSTLNLVRFERLVQGISTARTLWDIGLLGQYGVGDSGSFARAIGPFTHPVGTAHYFVVPLVLAATALMAARRARAPTMLAWLAFVVLFVAAVLTPISRGAWLAAVVGVIVAGLLYRRVLPAAVGIGLVVVFILLVPPFSYSVTSALGGTDSSVEGHGQAIEKGIKTAVDNPWGLGLGQADQFGASLAQEGASAAVGENLYLTLYVSVGPIGLLAFVAWVVGVLLSLIRAGPSRAEPWMQIGMAVVMIGLLVSGLTAAHLLRFTTGASFWLLVGLLVPNGPLPALGGSLRDLRARLYTRPHA